MDVILIVIFGLINIVLLGILFARQSNKDANRELQQLLVSQFDALQKNQERTERLVREEIAHNREEIRVSIQQSREEVRKSLEAFSNSVLARMAEVATLHKNQLDTFSKQLSTLTQMNEQKLEKMREVVEGRLKSLQEENSQKLEKMRETVDEKLHATLEKRLGDSFQLVSERLEKVHQGLGEMQNLASGVGDLKRVLANVKTRGMWGEVQLGNLLDEILTPQQYEKNIVTKKGSRDPVEFAIKFPGRDNSIVYLPIDSKFPLEDYEKLQFAQEQANPILVEEASKALESRLKFEAKNIRDKYLDPPQTTEFGFLFLPTESLYAEVLRRPGFADLLRKEFRVIVAGPTTIAVLLNSFQLGFQTLAVEKRASEVWSLLGMVKTEFNKFGDILDKTHKKLQEASNTIEDATRKSRTIERRLKSVQDIPIAIAQPEENLLEQKTIDAFLE